MRFHDDHHEDDDDDDAAADDDDDDHHHQGLVILTERDEQVRDAINRIQHPFLSQPDEGGGVPTLPQAAN